MESTRITRIRAAEEKSHTQVYLSEPLFGGSSWLKKPVRTVMELLEAFQGRECLRVLDLGCGVGRNSIPVARRFADCRVDCVDILEVAIERLNGYAEEYGVASQICGMVAPLEAFPIEKDAYDLVLGISALEHICSEAAFWETVERIAAGVRTGGAVCFVINSGITEADAATGEPLEPQFEVNLSTEALKAGLERIFAGWTVLKVSESRQTYEIPRDGMAVLTSNVLTWAAKKEI